MVQEGSGGSWVIDDFVNGYPGSNAFNGVANASSDAAVPNTANLPVTCRWEGTIKIPNGATVTAKVWCQAGSNSGYLKVNDFDVTPSATGDNTNLAEIDIAIPAGSAITSLEVQRKIVGNGGIGFAGIYINGVVVQRCKRDRYVLKF